jgi:probable rRNA maturation factor
MTDNLPLPPVEIGFGDPAEGWDAAACEAVARRAVAAAYATAGLHAMPGAELSIVFADDAAVHALNRQWRGKDRPTNVLTFPAVEPEEIDRSPLLGDIVLARETVRSEAEADGKTFHDHLAHLVVHGVLHLYGFDHEDEDEAEEMEEIERQALARIGIADPYGADATQEA